jgi:hypothetical protein
MLDMQKREDYDFRSVQKGVFREYPDKKISYHDALDMARDLVAYFMHEYKELMKHLPDDTLVRQEACLDFRETHRLPRQSNRKINDDLFLKLRNIVNKRGRSTLKKMHGRYKDEASEESRAASLNTPPSGRLADRFPHIVEFGLMPHFFMSSEQAKASEKAGWYGET